MPDQKLNKDIELVPEKIHWKKHITTKYSQDVEVKKP